MAKLALWFEKSDHARILNTEEVSPGETWKIGRGSGPPLTTICFHDQYVSVHHARIRFDEELGLWQVVDTNSKNGTYITGKKIPAGQWMTLRDGDKIDMGHSWVIVSYDPDDTLNGYKTLAPDGSEDDEEKTVMKLPGVPGIPSVPLPLPAPPLPRPSATTWVELAAIVLTGPSGFPSWAWWLCLLAAGVGVAWIWRR